ncbi:MAG: YfhO family protein [Candidatus Hydrogenedentes bacterium]|nr:YfhO family protein [Candidatus Hydrogenedentota bacterium]
MSADHGKGQAAFAANVLLAPDRKVRPPDRRIAHVQRLPYNRAMLNSQAQKGTTKPDGGTRWLTLLAGLAGAMLFLLLFYPLLRGNIYQGSDIGSQQFPYRSFYSYCLQHGFSFLWWPEEFCGYYLHAEGQGAFFHPLQWCLYRFLPLDLAFSIEFMASYLFLYGGMVALLRGWRLPWFAALFGANLFTFSGFVLFHYTHIQAIRVTSHLPWIMLALHVLLTTTNEKHLRRAWLALVGLVASQLLSGYPQYVLFTLMAVGLYMLFYLRGHGAVARMAAMVSAMLLGLMIAGVQVLPTFDLIGYAQRQDLTDFWKDGSLHPLNLLQWVGPYWFRNGISYGTPSWEYAAYAGAIPLVLSLWCVSRFKGLGRWQPMGLYAAALAAIMIVLALGEFGGVYRFIAMLPVMGAFRCPARHLMLVHFAVAILSAVALARLWRTPQGQRPSSPRTRRSSSGSVGPNRVLDSHVRGNDKTPTTPRRERVLLGLIAAAWATLLLVILLRQFGGADLQNAFTDSWPRLVAGPLLISGATLLVYTMQRWRKTGIVAILVFATLDAAFYTMPFVWNHKPQSSSYAALMAALAPELPDDPAFVPFGGEFRAHGNWRTARLSQLGLAGYMGYVGLPPAWKIDPNADVTKRVAGVRWEKRPLSNPNWTIHEDALPIARLVAQTVTSDTPREAIERIDVATTAIVAEAVEVSGKLAGTVTWLKNEPGNVVLQTTADTTQLLVFAQRYHPGWRVAVDGEARSLVRVNGDFMGCVVPQGEHEVAFVFWPKSFYYGLLVSGGGLLLTLGMWIVLGRVAGMASSSPETD